MSQAWGAAGLSTPFDSGKVATSWQASRSALPAPHLIGKYCWDGLAYSSSPYLDNSFKVVFSVYMCVPWIYMLCVYRSPWRLEEALDPLELEFRWSWMSMWLLGTKPRSCAVELSLNCKAISLAWLDFSLLFRLYNSVKQFSIFLKFFGITSYFKFLKI